MSEESDNKKGLKHHLKESFLVEFRNTGFIHAAADKVSIDPRTVYRWRQEDDTFREEFQAAQIRTVETLERVGMARAIKKSDLLMIFFLKALHPEKYKERFQHELDHKTIEILVSQFIGAIKKQAPEVCPHCKSHLGLPGKIAKELEYLTENLAANK